MTQLNALVGELKETSSVMPASVLQRYSRHTLAQEEFSTEAMVSAISQTLSYVKQSFNRLADTLESTPNNTAQIQSVKPWSDSEIRKFSVEIQNIKYFAYSDMKIAYSPQGMYKTYLEYYSALRPLCEHVSVCHKTIIKPYVEFLAGLLSELQGVLRTTQDNTETYLLLEKNRELMKQKLLACYKPGSEQETRMVSEVIKRGTDWQQVLMQAQECNNIVSPIDPGKILTDVKLACTYIDAIVNKLEDPKGSKLQNANKQILTVLSAGAWQMSQEVELIPVVIFKNQLIMSSVLRTAQNVQKTVLFKSQENA